jgi:hypothetical protein
MLKKEVTISGPKRQLHLPEYNTVTEKHDWCNGEEKQKTMKQISL